MSRARIEFCDVETRESGFADSHTLATEAATTIARMQERRTGFLFAIWNLSEEGQRERIEASTQPKILHKESEIVKTYTDPIAVGIQSVPNEYFSDNAVLLRFIELTGLKASTSYGFILELKRQLKEDVEEPRFEWLLDLEQKLERSRESNYTRKKKNVISYSKKAELFLQAVSEVKATKEAAA